MENLTEKIDALFAENKGAEAESLLEQALKEAYENQYFLDAVPILNELIGYCRETGQVERSYVYAAEVQEILQKIGLEGSLEQGTTLLNIANAYRAGGRLKDSLQKYEEVEVIYKELLEDNDMLWASFHNNISLLYQEMKRFDWAKEALLKALDIVIRKKDTIFEQAVTYTNLANTCLQLKQENEAEKYFTGALLLFEKYQIKDTHYCAALSALGTFCFQRKEYEKAQKYFLKAMEGIEAHLGKNEYYSRMKENAALCEELLSLSRNEWQSSTKEREESEKEKKEKQYQRISENSREAEGTEKRITKENEVQWVNGLALSREYFEQYGKPMLENKFPEYMSRIAVGLVGEGSDCFGYDDAFSADHDWGPGFCMWLSEDLYEEIGEELQKEYDNLPKEYKGYVYKESIQGQGRRGVQRIDDFYARVLGTNHYSEDSIQWEEIDKACLAAAVNGEIFQDEEGSFSKIRYRLREGYPMRFRYLDMAESVARFSQNLQYNYGRMQQRGEYATARIMLADGVKEGLKLLYYLAQEYPPHEKWLFKGLRNKPEYQQILNLLEELLVKADTDKEACAEAIGEKMAYLMYRADYISDVSPFLQEHVNELLFKAACVEDDIEELAEKIARLEFKAFDKVKNVGGRADCQDDWFTFSVMRKSQYLTWNKRMLMQYYYDFTRELTAGHNLIEEKYGRMMESTAPSEYEKIKEHFPPLSMQKKQIIEEIVRMQVKWMEEFAAEYPKLAGNARSIHTYEDHMWNTSYETYLRGEISTYSDKMLELYGRYIVEYAGSDRNPAKEIMEQSVLLYGYTGLTEAEAVL